MFRRYVTRIAVAGVAALAASTVPAIAEPAGDASAGTGDTTKVYGNTPEDLQPFGRFVQERCFGPMTPARSYVSAGGSNIRTVAPRPRNSSPPPSAPPPSSG